MVTLTRGERGHGRGIGVFSGPCLQLSNQPSSRAPEPGTINYNRLSPASAEMLAEVGLRMTAGWDNAEILAHFNAHPPRFRHVPPPSKGAFTSGWLSGNMGRLRDELVASVDPDD
jgi:hypothetical protein